MATSNIAYRINYSDKGRAGKAGSIDNFFVIDPLGTNESSTVKRDTNGNQISPKKLSTPLQYTGYRNPEFGERLWTNMLQILENFASKTAPNDPQLGQLWFDKNSERGTGTLKLCTNAAESTWTTLNHRIIVSDTAPTVSGPAPEMNVLEPTLWYNPINRGLFFWDPNTKITHTTTASPPYPISEQIINDNGTVTKRDTIYTILDPTGYTTSDWKQPNPHPRISTLDGSKWVNVFSRRYASTIEYNEFVNKFIANALPPTNRPVPVADGQHPTDEQWYDLIKYVRTQGATLAPSLLNTLVDTHFRYYSTDRYGYGLLQQRYDALVNVVDAVIEELGTDPIPLAAFTQSQSVGPTPMTVSFVNRSVNTTGATYLWNFGNGATSTLQNPTYVYTTAGTFTVTLTVTTPFGQSTASRILQTFGAPVASFTRTPTSGLIPLSVTFTDTSTSVPTSWLWNFGNGVTSTLQNPTYTYTVAGTYTVTLTAANAAGSSQVTNTVTAAVPVVIVAPVASFTRTPPSGAMTITFTDTSANTPTSWAWNFGDGNTSTARNPVHTYTVPGTYTVTLIVFNAAGSSTSTSTVIARVIPVASFTRTPASGTVPFAVTFTDTSANTPTSWAWNFGNGATSTARNPVHTYTTAGTFTATLTALNDAGSNTATSTVVANPGAMTITVVSDISNFNAYAAATSYNPAIVNTGTYVPGMTVNIVINPGVVVSANSTAAYAFNTGTGWNAADIITLTNNGVIVGRGGTGGVNHGGFSSPGGPGTAGGPGLVATVPLRINNAGTIAGGGGGGGAAGSPTNQASYWVESGGGGGGAGFGAGGTSGAYSYGSPGSLWTGGAGGVGYANVVAGAGGSLGATGATGGTGSHSGPNGGAGGGGGSAVHGNGNITWVALGSRIGAIG